MRKKFGKTFANFRQPKEVTIGCDLIIRVTGICPRKLHARFTSTEHASKECGAIIPKASLMLVTADKIGGG